MGLRLPESGIRDGKAESGFERTIIGGTLPLAKGAIQMLAGAHGLTIYRFGSMLSITRHAGVGPQGRNAGMDQRQ